MAKYCPLRNGPVLYLDCLECEDKVCKEKDKARSNEGSDTKPKERK